jgi:hypothetical protein
MATCTGREYTTEIERTECIGNSLVTINNNFRSIDTQICSIVNDYVTPQLAIELNASFTILPEYHDKTIVINSANQVNITLPTTVPPGTQVSFIRALSGDVRFVGDTGVSVRSTPDNSFVSFAFVNSVATAYFWNNNTWFVFGDLIP